MNFSDNVFPPDYEYSASNNLKTAYLEGGAGTYTRAANGESWTKQ